MIVLPKCFSPERLPPNDVHPIPGHFLRQALLTQYFNDLIHLCCSPHVKNSSPWYTLIQMRIYLQFFGQAACTLKPDLTTRRRPPMRSRVLGSDAADACQRWKVRRVPTRCTHKVSVKHVLVICPCSFLLDHAERCNTMHLTRLRQSAQRCRDIRGISRSVGPATNRQDCSVTISLLCPLVSLVRKFLCFGQRCAGGSGRTSV